MIGVIKILIIFANETLTILTRRTYSTVRYMRAYLKVIYIINIIFFTNFTKKLSL